MIEELGIQRKAHWEGGESGIHLVGSPGMSSQEENVLVSRAISLNGESSLKNESNLGIDAD